MKRLLILAITLLLVSCGTSEPPPTRTPTPPQDITGFVYFEDSENGLKFQHPEQWAELDASVLDDDADTAALCAMLGISANTLRNALSESTLIILFDADDLANDENNIANDTTNDAARALDITPVFSVRVVFADGFSPNSLRDKATVAEFRTAFAARFSETFANQFESDASFAWIKEPTSEEFGNNVLITYAADITAGEVRQTIYQAIAVGTDKFFFFTFTEPFSNRGSNSPSIPRAILSSVVIE